MTEKQIIRNQIFKYISDINGHSLEINLLKKKVKELRGKLKK